MLRDGATTRAPYSGSRWRRFEEPKLNRVERRVPDGRRAFADGVARFEPGNERLNVGGVRSREVVAHIQPLIVVEELGPVAGERFHEVLADARSEVECAGPEMSCPGLTRFPDHGLELFGPVGDAREDRSEAHTGVDAGGRQAAEDAKALGWWGGAWLGHPPHLPVERGD